MKDELETVLHTDATIADYFAIETKLLETRTAELFRAKDKSRGTHIGLWVMRHRFIRNAMEVRRFLARMQELQGTTPPLSLMNSFGVDSEGTAFAVFPALDGTGLVSAKIERAEAQRRFLAALKIVERLHAAGIVCGDITSGSFLVERNGDVRLVGVMGSFENDPNSLKATPDIMAYVAPEQPRGELTSATDVYALGVLGYVLFAKRFPQVDPRLGRTRPVKEFWRDAPSWCDDLFNQALQEDPELRFADAGAMSSALTQSRDRGIEAAQVPAKVAGSEARTKKRAEEGQAMLFKAGRSAADSADMPGPGAPPARRGVSTKKVIGLAVGVTLIYVIGLTVLKMVRSDRALRVDFSQHDSAISDPSLKQALTDISNAGSDDTQRAAALHKIVMSDDPLYHDVLIKMATGARSDAARDEVERSILDRARRLGLKRSVEIVRPWLKTLNSANLPVAYEPVLRALDATLPAEARDGALRRAYVDAPRMVLRLAASLALDTERLEDAQPVLAQMVGDATKSTDLGARSALALMLYSVDLASSFADDVIQRRASIPDADIVWLLQILSQRNDIHVRPIAHLALERDLLPKGRAYYLRIVQDKEELPSEILSILIRAAGGGLTREDIGEIGGWFDMKSGELLLAIATDSSDTEILNSVFDNLVGKSTITQPAKGLLEWVRDTMWERRAQFVRSIGVFALSDLFSDEQISEAMAIFDPYIREPRVISAFAENGSPALARAALKRYGEKVGLARRLMMLENPDPTVRILALRSLSELNDVAGLKIVIDHYRQERDPKVKEAYKESFWVIREREGGM